MKRIIFVLVALFLSVSFVQAEKKAKNVKGLEGEKVRTVSLKLSGIEMSDGLSEDGLSLVKVAYKWYAGIGKADDKQLAVELAQREAYATISRILEDAVNDESERRKLANNGRVQQALDSHWKQVSNSLQHGCEPFGDVELEYDKNTQMYEATAKIAIRGDRFIKLLNQASEVEPEGLTGSDLQEFIDANNAIINAAKEQ